MNKVILMGRLTKDVELRYTQNNTPVATFTLAVNRKMSKEKETDFINIVAWNKNAEFVSQYFKKGQQVLVSGRLQVRTWEDEKGKHTVYEVVAEENEFADSKKDDGESQTTFSQNFTPTADDDLPF